MYVYTYITITIRVLCFFWEHSAVDARRHNMYMPGLGNPVCLLRVVALWSARCTCFAALCKAGWLHCAVLAVGARRAVRFSATCCGSWSLACGVLADVWRSRRCNNKLAELHADLFSRHVSPLEVACSSGGLRKRWRCYIRWDLSSMQRGTANKEAWLAEVCSSQTGLWFYCSRPLCTYTYVLRTYNIVVC